jgi:limonene-1,2-epoxide hydrolase
MCVLCRRSVRVEAPGEIKELIMSAPTSPAEIAVAFIEAFGRRDTDAMSRYVDEDIVFECPRGTIRGVPAVLEVVGEFAQVVAMVKILAVLGNDTEAMIMYDMEAGHFGTLRAVDHLVVRGGKIISDRLVFDTYELRNA